MQDALIQQLLLAPALNRLMGMQWSTDDLLDIVRLLSRGGFLTHARGMARVTRSCATCCWPRPA